MVNYIEKVIKKIRQETSAWVIAFCRSAPGSTGRRLRNLVFSKKIKNAGTNIYFAQGVWLNGWQNVSIGDQARFDRNCILTSIMVTLEIGNNSAFNSNVTLGADGGCIKIGNDVIVGMNTVMRATNHNFHKSPKILIRKQGHTEGNIIIGNDVWIGADVMIDFSVGSLLSSNLMGFLFKVSCCASDNSSLQE